MDTAYSVQLQSHVWRKWLFIDMDPTSPWQLVSKEQPLFKKKIGDVEPKLTIQNYQLNIIIFLPF